MIGALVAGITGSGGAVLSSYESIATVTSTGSTSVITFNSIPSTFKHLQIRGIARGTFAGAAVQLAITTNNVSTASYATHALTGDGASAGAVGYTAQNSIYAPQVPGSTATADQFGAVIFDILDYAESAKNKTLRIFGGNDRNGAGQISIWSGFRADTSAITRLDISITAGGNFANNSTFALYGIKEA